MIGFICNKEDLYTKEEVKEEEIEKYAQEKKAPYKYTSAQLHQALKNSYKNK